MFPRRQPVAIGPQLRLLACLACTAAAVPPAAAQSPTAPSLHLRSGQAVRVAIPGEGRLTGTVLALDDGLLLQTSDGPRRFETLPDTLWTRGANVGRSVLIGVAGGAVVGFALGSLVVATCGDDCGLGTQFLVSSAGVGAGLGALVAALGSLADSGWRRRRP